MSSLAAEFGASVRAEVLKLMLLMRGNQRIMVINIPWYL